MTLPLTHAIFVAFLGFAYLAIGAVVAGCFERSQPVYDYTEWWWLLTLFWPLTLAWMLVGVAFVFVDFLGTPLRWIYHRVRLWGRDEEL